MKYVMLNEVPARPGKHLGRVERTLDSECARIPLLPAQILPSTALGTSRYAQNDNIELEEVAFA